MCFSTRTRWISSFCQTGQSLANEAWGPLQLEHSLVSHIDLHAYLFHNSYTLQQPCNIGSCVQTCCSWSNVLWIETLTGLSINLFVQSRFWAWALLPHSTRKDPSLNLLMLLRVPATRLGNPSEQQRATVCSAGGHHLMAPRPETLANCCRNCRSVHFQSPIPNLGRRLIIFFYLWVPCYVFERFIMFRPHPPPSPTRGCTQAAF